MTERATSGRGLHTHQSHFVRALALDAKDRLAAGPSTPARRAAWKAVNAWCHSEGTQRASRSARTRHGIESFRYLFVKSLRVRAQKRRDDAESLDEQRAWDEILEWVLQESLARYVGDNGQISLPAHPREDEIERRAETAPPPQPRPPRTRPTPVAIPANGAPPPWFTQWLERDPTSHASVSLALWLAFQHPAKSHPANEEDWQRCERLLSRIPRDARLHDRLVALADARPSWKAWLTRGGHLEGATPLFASREPAPTPAETKKKTRRGRRGGRRHKRKTDTGHEAG